MPTVMPAISPVIAPVGGAQVPGRFGGPVSLNRLLKYKGKSSRMRNGIMVVLGIALVAGSVKLLVSSGTPKLATAAGSDAVPAPGPAAATQPTTKPTAKPKTVLTADAKGSNAKPIPTQAPVTTPAKPRTAATDAKAGRKPVGGSARAGKTSAGAKSSSTAAAGAEHVDKAAGYSVKFPVGWTQRNLGGRGSWLAEASDGKSSSMAVGLGPDGGRSVADATNLEALTKAYQARPDTVVQGSGFGTLAGQKCMWHKLSVPAPAKAGAAASTDAAASRITTVQYFAPLGDGRALKVRVVSRPETFAEAARTMKQSLVTLKLLTPDSAARQVAAGE